MRPTFSIHEKYILHVIIPTKAKIILVYSIVTEAYCSQFEMWMLKVKRKPEKGRATERERKRESKREKEQQRKVDFVV